MKFRMHHRLPILIIGVPIVLLGVIGVLSVLLALSYSSHTQKVAPTAIVKAKPTPAAPVTTQPTTPLPPQKMTPDYVIPAAVDGEAPVLTTIPTTLPVVYLGIDDGANKTQAEIDLLKQDDIKATLFLSDLFIADDPGFFVPIIGNGSLVEDHTLHHDTEMAGKSYDYQKEEICGMADHDVQYYGRRPTLFRPPGGAYSDTMLKAAHDCGMKAVVTWIAKANGGSMQYQIGDHLRPGDIVLMHFRPEFAQDLGAFVAAEKAAGLHTELLEDLQGAT